MSKVLGQGKKEMMMWIFKTIEPGYPERDPKETEFFKISSPAEAVIREFIQNSLDARKTNSKMITIKVMLRHVNAKNVGRFLDDELKKHLTASGFLDTSKYPEIIPCLILEDFGTTGLDGPYDCKAGNGNFYNFWWREGISEKREQRAGRWGLGKTSFHMVSKIRTFFGVTVRPDGKILLMGKALLKTHTLGNKRYHYFGYFSTDDFRPVEDDAVVTEFNNNFGISRDNTATGLSLVIPLPVDEINFDTLLRGTIRHYFYPILAGVLKAEIQGDNRQEELNESNLITKISSINWSNSEWEGVSIKEILEFVKAAIGMSPIDLRIENQEVPEINQVSFGNQLDAIKKSFLSREPVKFRVPFHLRKKNGMGLDTSFTVLLKRFPDLKRPFECYVRSGILISEIKVLENHPVAGLLIADDQPVSEFLGDCETPAHTSWNERTEGFSDKYTNAARILRFIKRSMNQIVTILDEPPQQREKEFWKAMFAIPETDKEEGELTEEKTKIISGSLVQINYEDGLLKVKTRSGGEWEVKLTQETKIADNGRNRLRCNDLETGFTVKVIGIVDTEKKPAANILIAKHIIVNPVEPFFLIDQIATGFKIYRNPTIPHVPSGAYLKITVAYDIRREDPFKRYNPLDFDFTQPSGVSISEKNCAVQLMDKNVVIIKIIDQDFSLEVKGFDLGRDIVVDVKQIREGRDEAQI